MLRHSTGKPDFFLLNITPTHISVRPNRPPSLLPPRIKSCSTQIKSMVSQIWEGGGGGGGQPQQGPKTPQIKTGAPQIWGGGGGGGGHKHY